MNKDVQALDHSSGDQGQAGGLTRAVGAVVVALSALAQEYGSGINFVMPHSLGRYPGVGSLVPLAMVAAGVVLIPKVFLFGRYSRVMPRAGSGYVWLSRSVGPQVGFPIAFMWFIGVCGGIGFLAYASGTFIGDALQSLGFDPAWAVSKPGHLIIGMAAIWLITGLHVSGVKNYAYLVYLAGGLIFAAAAVIVYTGFTIDPHEMAHRLASVAGVHRGLQSAHTSLSAFVSTIALFMFAYGGLTGAASLGGETTNPKKNMPIGIVMGWALALVLYALVTFALFHAVPWRLAAAIAKSHDSYLLTAPALVGLVQSRPVAVFLNVLVALIVLKTIGPALLDASRYLYAWAQDGLVSRRFVVTNTKQAPAGAVLLSATLGSAFLFDAVFAGWSIGVVVRAASVAATFAVLGLGTLMLSWWPRWRASRAFAADITAGWLVKAMSLLALVLGVLLIVSVVVSPGEPWYFQPWFQILVSFGIAGALMALAFNRAADDFTERFRLEPPED